MRSSSSITVFHKITSGSSWVRGALLGSSAGVTAYPWVWVKMLWWAWIREEHSVWVPTVEAGRKVEQGLPGKVSLPG